MYREKNIVCIGWDTVCTLRHPWGRGSLNVSPMDQGRLLYYDVSGLVETNYSKETLGPTQLESIIQLLSEYVS